MMKSKKLLIISVIVLTSMSCTLSGLQHQIFGPVLAIFPGLADVEPEKDEGEPEHTFEPLQGWTCVPSDLSHYLDDSWQEFQTLQLKMWSNKDTLIFQTDFRSESQFLVKREPDYRPPPGATLVPEGEYLFEETYLGSGEAALQDALQPIYLGSIDVEYVLETHFPDPEVTEGKIAYQTIGRLLSPGELEICLDVYEGGYAAAVNDPVNHLSPNCRWPGYIFNCILDK